MEGDRPPSKAENGVFAYQQRVLDGLTRNSSISRPASRTTGILSPTPGARRYVPTHRATVSVDSIRGGRRHTSADRNLLAHESESPVQSSSEASTSTSVERPNSTTEANRQPSSSRSEAFVAPLSGTPALSRRDTHTTNLEPSTSTESQSSLPTRPSSATSGSFRFPQPIKGGLHRANAVLDRTRPEPVASSSLPSVKRHNSAASVDSVRGRWEELAREADSSNISPQSTGTSSQRGTLTPASSHQPKFPGLERQGSLRNSHYESSEPPPPSPTPTHLKRQTLPIPPKASVRDLWEERAQANEIVHDTPLRAHLSDKQLPISPRERVTSTTGAKQIATLPATTSPSPFHEVSTFDRFPATLSKRHTLPTPLPISSSTPPTSSKSPSSQTNDMPFSPFSSSYGASPQHINLPSQSSLQTSSVAGVKDLSSLSSPNTVQDGLSNSINSPARYEYRSDYHEDSVSPSASSSTSTIDPMHPTPYRSSKREKYGSIFGSRRLGNHLPRIASGDGNNDWEEGPSSATLSNPPPTGHSRAERTTRITPQTSPTRPSPSDIVSSNSGNSSTVIGRPDRIRFSRSTLPTPSTAAPLPSGSARIIDKQRHLLIAYEYLCHVGEAQQWIEGCLDEEVGFGVVEMEEGLRNGVVLARLVRVFEGEAVVRRIFEHPKLQFRHSDNIAYFFTFVRKIGLPEGFIFELTDLYEKKNIPKVIYCIHALSYLLARRGMASRIGNLVGHLDFTDDQLQTTQKGLTDSGVAMPNFKGVGRQLAKEINEEPEEEIETEEDRRDRLLMESEDSIVSAQTAARRFIAQRSLNQRKRLLIEREGSIITTQAAIRRFIAQRSLNQHMRLLMGSEDSIVSAQTAARRFIAQRSLNQRKRLLIEREGSIITTQAAIRRFVAQQGLSQRKRLLTANDEAVVTTQAAVRRYIAQQRLAQRKQQLAASIPSIVLLQSAARGFFARRAVDLERKALAAHQSRLRLAERYVVKTQALCRAVLARRQHTETRATHADLTPWAVSLQSHIRGALIRHRWYFYLDEIYGATNAITHIQARARGVLERRKYAKLKGALRSVKFSVVKLQAMVRARISQRTHTEAVKTLQQPIILNAMLALQAQARGVLQRRRTEGIRASLSRIEPHVLDFQSHLRGALLRRRVMNQLRKLDDAEGTIIRIQAACRSILARNRLLALIRGLRQATPSVLNVQTMARAMLARRSRVSLAKSLGEAHVIKSVGGLQTFARAALARKRREERAKEFEFVMPDVVELQAACRGALLRDEYYAWRDFLHESHGEAIFLQSLIRGAMERRRFRSKMAYYRANLDKVVKIQSLFRAKEQREQYRQLTMGTNVNVSTIKNFVHLLDDSETDFKQEIEVERLRQRVVESIRENQVLETEVSELDVKIALVVQNVKSFEELIKIRRRGDDSVASHAARSKVLAKYNDPFAGSHMLDHATKRRLELYQQLFYLLQTRSEYFAKLFFHLTRLEVPEKTLRMAERVVLTIFGYGQDRREDYLLLKLFQLSIEEEIGSSPSIFEVMNVTPMYVNIVVHYVRPRQVAYVRDTLQIIIRDIVQRDDLDLETDPVAIYRKRIEDEEMRTGRTSTRKKDISLDEAINDRDTYPEYIRNLQKLQALTDVFVKAITNSTRKMPYGMRFIARETLNVVKTRFPNQPPETYSAVLGRLVYYRYLNPAIVTPETFDLISNTLGPVHRKNLLAISKMLTQIASGEVFGESNVLLQPLDAYVAETLDEFSRWFLEVADVPDAEAHFDAHEFLDVTVQPKPIYISPNEVYAMHSLLAENLDILASQREDPLRVILTELAGVPNLGSDELKEARDRAVTLELTNRFADIRDPHAHEKALWVQAKRGVLAVLRVQPTSDLIAALVEQPTEQHELLWEEIVNNELIYDSMQQQHQRRMPSTTAATESAYRLEDIRSLPYTRVKENALFYLLELEKLGKVTRSDGYQGILNAIAGDVRSKHRKRIARKHEMDAMNDALAHLRERKAGYDDQIKSYHSYIDSAMATMQKGKGNKRFLMPFTKQFNHQRHMAKTGRIPKYGSYIYSAQDFWNRGILLSLDAISPRMLGQVDVILESDVVGVYTIKLTSTTEGMTSLVAEENVKMEDLLQAKFENRQSVSLFDGMAKVNLKEFVDQINKKFHVS